MGVKTILKGLRFCTMRTAVEDIKKAIEQNKKARQDLLDSIHRHENHKKVANP